jgi:hypothetical protein
MDTTHIIPENHSDNIRTLKVLYRLPQAQAMALQLLLDHHVVSVQEITAAGVSPSVQSTRVVMHRLKLFLDGHGTKLETGRETGYWLTPENKLIFAQEIKNFLYPER